MRGDDALGLARRARGEEQLDDGVGTDLGVRFGQRRAGPRGRQVGEGAHGAALEPAFGQHHRHLGRHHGGDGARVFRAAGEDHARLGDGQDVAQLAEVLRDERVGGRDGDVGYAGPHRRQRQRQVLDVVAREDGQRPLLRQAGVQQRLTHGLHLLQHLGVADVVPVAALRAARDEAAPGRLGGPLLEAVGEALGVPAQCVRRAQHGAAVGAKLNLGLEAAAHVGIAVARHVQAPLRLFTTLPARPSRKARSRRCASGVLSATAAISDSVN